MKQRYFLTLLFLTVALSSGQNPGDIIITEIMQNPGVVNDADGEWFEVYNTTGADIDMDGWTVRDDGADSFVIVGALIVPAGSYIVLGNNADAGTNGGVTVNYDYGMDMSIANVADEIVLEAPGAVIIDIVAYDGGPDFPDPSGASMELSQSNFDATDNDDGANWGEATTPFGDGDLGSPGADNDFVLSAKQTDIEGFNLYPNPVTNNKVTITTARNLTKNIVIFDVLGKRVLNRILPGNVLDVGALDTGIYIIKITEDKKTTTRKLVIR